MLPNSELTNLGDFITDRLPIKNVVFGVIKKKRKTIIILDSFGDSDGFESYYRLFEPTNGKKVSNERELFDPIASDLYETIDLFFQDKKVKWQFGLTLSALEEIKEVAKSKGHL